MVHYKIMNLLLSDSQQFMYAPTMLCRGSRLFKRSTSDDGAWSFDGAGEYDFTTFFNALSVGKWKTYTVANEFGLHFEYRGTAGRVAQTRADSFSWYSEEIAETSIELPQTDSWITVDFPMAGYDADVIEAFKIASDGAFEIRDAYYYAVIDEADIRPVELALCTTTFKKEDFIERNIGLVRREILGSDEPIAKHFHMHVVDNGRTLDAAALSGGCVTVYPNDNVGGAGGFARGMIQAMEQEPQATHVLLMDDDVLVSTESIIRTYNLLTIVNDEYKDAFVSGAMMNMDEPNVRWEEMGFIGHDGAFHPLKPVAHMDILHDVASNEAFDNPCYLEGYEDQARCYAAWWYCVIPMSMIKKNGLPLPVFVRGDDVEYSRRCKPKFMTLNGICIWHLSFHLRYNAAQERYQMTRNCFIDSFVSDIAPAKEFEDQLDKAVQLELKKFNYRNAELILQGFEDFLKGPEWIMQPVAQKAFMDANKNAEKLEPFDQLYNDALDAGTDLHGLTIWKLDRDTARTLPDRALDFLTVNRQRFAVGNIGEGGTAVIEAAGWEYPAGKISDTDTIVVIDPPNRKGAIRHRDTDRFNAVWKRYKDDMKEYKRKRNELKRAYQAAKPIMTSVAFWKKYLDMES